MAIPYSGTYKRSAGLVSALGKQIKKLNLKPVKNINFSFDPFHPNTPVVRELLFYLSGPKVIGTNTNCRFKTNVVTDRSEPFVKIDVEDRYVLKL